tara:strand:- start:241433 stop:242026 length:594 start_codon:yes stop_codon:yes gene_type:complete
VGLKKDPPFLLPEPKVKIYRTSFMARSQLELKIRDIIAPAVEDMGYSLVAVAMLQQGGAPVLQIMAEDQDGNLTLDDCTKISHEVSALLDVEDPIPSAYQLEVSTPGIDRPLFTAQDFERFIGFDAKIELLMPIETGQKKFRGEIKSVDGDTVTILADNSDVNFEPDNLAKAKLVLTDDLIKKTKEAKEQKLAANEA